MFSRFQPTTCLRIEMLIKSHHCVKCEQEPKLIEQSH